jgi:hypothetical protein
VLWGDERVEVGCGFVEDCDQDEVPDSVFSFDAMEELRMIDLREIRTRW